MSTSSLTSAPFLSFFSLLPFLSLAFSLSRLLYLSLFRREPGQWQRDATKRNPFARNEVQSSKTEEKLRFPSRPAQPFRTKWGSIVENWGKIAISRCPPQPFRTKWGSIVKNWRKLRFQVVPRNPFARNEVRSSKTEVKLRFPSGLRRPSRTKWGSIVKNWGKIAISSRPAQPFRTKWGSIVKNWGKIVCV